MKALTQLNLDNVVFIDIETVRAEKELTKDSPFYEAWDYKMKYGRDPIGGADHAASFKEQASLYAEFGKIIVITIGKIQDGVLKLKSYANHDEKALLTEFCTTLNAMIGKNKNTVLCGHAVKGFDIPWMMRRCIVHQIELPSLLDTGHLKPWETTAVDTMDLWKGTAFNGASLTAIAACLGIPNPKDDISGYQTSETYYNEPEGLDRIRKYCEKDVTTVANIVRKCRYEPIVSVDSKPVEEAKEIPLLTKLYNGGKYTLKDAKFLTDEYAKLDEAGKKAMELILRSIPDKNTSFTVENVEAIINYKPKQK